MGSVKSFEDLECWKMGTELRREISQLIKTYPSFEKFELVSQMRRASRSITHNIAEGYGRYHYQENVQFCRTARGSAYEIIDQLITSLDEEYIGQEKYEKLRLMAVNCIKILNGYINYLLKIKNN